MRARAARDVPYPAEAARTEVRQRLVHLTCCEAVDNLSVVQIVAEVPGVRGAGCPVACTLSLQDGSAGVASAAHPREIKMNLERNTGHFVFGAVPAAGKPSSLPHI